MATVEHCLFCFEALSAELEKRTPMTLNQVQASWADYPKGLEESEMPATEDNEETSEASESEPSLSSSKQKLKTNPALERLLAPSPSRTGTSTPSSTSSTSLTPSDTNSPATSTPASSITSFRPIGIGRHSSQHVIAPLTSSPLFVTWNKISANTSPRLRGCIGTFEAQPLSSGLASYALTSALSDTRFSPVTLAELPRLEVSVTLLTDFETCNDPMDWEIGVHGLKLAFYHHHRRYGATYLPDVAVEQGWDKEETLVSLMRKAGWLGRRGKWMEVADLKVVRYQGKKESVDWEEFRRWREWADGKGEEEE